MVMTSTPANVPKIEAGVRALALGTLIVKSSVGIADILRIMFALWRAEIDDHQLSLE